MRPGLVDSFVKSFNADTQSLNFFGAINGNGASTSPLTALVYGAASIIPNARAGNFFTVTITDGNAFAIGAPINPPSAAGTGQRLSITFINSSGGAAGAGTFNAIYKMASNTLAVIADGKNRTYEFQWNGTNWVEVFHTAADVAN